MEDLLNKEVQWLAVVDGTVQQTCKHKLEWNGIFMPNYTRASPMLI